MAIGQDIASVVVAPSRITLKSSIRPRSSAQGWTPSEELLGVLELDRPGGAHLDDQPVGDRHRHRDAVVVVAGRALADHQRAGLADGEADLFDEVLVLAGPAGDCGRDEADGAYESGIPDDDHRDGRPAALGA